MRTSTRTPAATVGVISLASEAGVVRVVGATVYDKITRVNHNDKSDCEVT